MRPHHKIKRIQNVNIVFRSSEDFKQKLRRYADANDIQLSTAIRNACSELLKREMPELFPHLAVNYFKRLNEIAANGGSIDLTADVPVTAGEIQ